MGHIRIFMVPLLHFQFYTLQGIEQNKLEDLVLFDVNAMSNIHLYLFQYTYSYWLHVNVSVFVCSVHFFIKQIYIKHSVSVSHTEDIAYKTQQISFPMRAFTLVEKTDYKQAKRKLDRKILQEKLGREPERKIIPHILFGFRSN